MSSILRLFALAALPLLGFAQGAQADFIVLLDTDNNPASGCTVTLPSAGTVNGIEHRLTATVSASAPPRVTQVTLETCSSGSFGAPTVLPGTPYPVGEDLGTAGSDVVELAVSASLIPTPGRTLRVYFAANGGDDDLVGADGAPLLLALANGDPAAIPTLTVWGWFALVVLVLVATRRMRMRFPSGLASLVIAGVFVGMLAWAAGFVTDGQINDWQGVAPLGNDASGDSDPGTDLLAGYAASEGGTLFFRMDAANIETAPGVSSITPADNATNVSVSSNVLVTFSEPVTLGGTWFQINCASSGIHTTALINGPGANQYTLDPDTDFASGETCTVTVDASQVTDQDGVDPPDNMPANFTASFTTADTAPTLTGSTPTDSASNVAINTNIALNFSEAVAVGASSFTLDCGGGALAYALGGSGTANVSLDPSADLPLGANCTVTVHGANVSDSDSVDPPDTMITDPTVSFTTVPPQANNDAYNVSPHLTLAVDTGIQDGRVIANDQLGAASITGFGFSPACSGTSPGNPLDAGAGNGRLTLNANGSFSYEPPAGVSNTTKTFCYTVTGGDTANIVFTLQNTELVWFVDAAAAAGGNGTQARPFQTLTSAAGADTDADTIFVKHNASAYACGVTLQASEKLIGEGSGGSLATLSGVTPVAGSSLPTLTNSSSQWPTLTAAADCLTLATGNTLRGFNFGNVGATNTAISGSSFNTLTVSDAAINTDGRALNLATGTLDATFTGITSTGGANNIVLSNIDTIGTASLGSGGLSGATGNAFEINTAGGSGSFTYAGSITNTAAARLVNIANKDGGTVTLSGNLSGTGSSTGINIASNANATIELSGTTKTLTTGTNPAVTLTSNTGSTINFSGGGLAISATSAAGFNATGGGTVNVTGSGNTLTTTTGTALNVANTTIGASGLNFQSISANGAANGIVLNTTGSTGALTVTGSGSANSGGTIQNTTGHGVSVTSGRINLSYLRILNPAGHGISASNLLGSSALSNCTVTGFDNGGSNTENGLNVVNNNTNLSGLTVSGTTFSNATAGNDGIYMEAQGTSAMTLTVNNASSFTGLRGDGLQVNRIAGATGEVRVTVNGSSFTSAVGGTGKGGISLNPAGSGNFLVDVNGNTFSSLMNAASTAGAIDVLSTGSAATDVTLRNNTLSGIAAARGVYVSASGGTTDLLVQNNQINGLGATNREAILVQLTNGAGTHNVTLQNNAIGLNGNLWSSGSGITDAIVLQTEGTASTAAAMTGNTVTANSNFTDAFVRAIGTSTLNVTVNNGNTFSNTVGTTAFEAIAGDGANAATLNLSITGNTIAGGDSIDLDENNVATMNLTQASTAAIAAANPSAVVNVLGNALTFNAASPTLPSTPTLP